MDKLILGRALPEYTLPVSIMSVTLQLFHGFVVQKVGPHQGTAVRWGIELANEVDFSLGAQRTHCRELDVC